MNLLKISSISFLVFCSLVFGSPVSATTFTVVNGKTVTLADVNIYDAKITSQKSNQINISFNINNGQGVQSGVKYGVSLIKESGSKQTIVDEYIFPEVLSLSSNSSLIKNISYLAPTNISGDYSVLLKVNNESGLSLGLGLAGKVKLVSTTKNIEILNDTCYLTVSGEKASPKYTLTQGVDIATTENLILNCSVLNPSGTEVLATPTYETHYRSTYGEIVAQEGGDLKPITFKAGEKKTISLTLPKAIKPQSYDIKIALKSGDVPSNSATVHYVLKGVSATIQNFSLDKDYYNKNDIAKISFLWSSSSDNFPDSRLSSTKSPDVLLVATLTNDKKDECITPINKDIKDELGSINLTAPITANCQNPQATITLKDASGNILDQKSLSFETKTDKVNKTGILGSTKTILIIFGILIVAGFAVYFINLKKKENETNQ